MSLLLDQNYFEVEMQQTIILGRLCNLQLMEPQNDLPIQFSYGRADTKQIARMLNYYWLQLSLNSNTAALKGLNPDIGTII